MLYDPKWEIKIKPEFSFDGLITWLQNQPKDEAYNYLDSETCLAAQFHEACGLSYSTPNPFLLWKFWTDFRYKLEWLACHGKRTFGAALYRAQDANADQS